MTMTDPLRDSLPPSPSASSSSAAAGPRRLHPDLSDKLIPQLKDLHGVARIWGSGALKAPTLWVEIVRGERTFMEIATIMRGFQHMHPRVPFQFEILYLDQISYRMLAQGAIEL